MISLRKTMIIGLSLLGAAGCEGLPGASVQRVHLAPVDAGASIDGSMPDAGVFLADGGFASAIPLGPQPLNFSGAVLLSDGGTLAFRLVAEEPSLEIGKADALVLNFPSRLVDYRVRLFDRAEMVLPTDDQEAALPDGGLEYRIAFQPPLKPGRTYSLTVDAQVHAAISDDRGHLFKDRTLDLLVSGVAEPEAPVKTKKRRSKRTAKAPP